MKEPKELKVDFPSRATREGFASLTACYGNKAKIIFLVRHGVKNGEHISRDCLDDIIDHGFDGMSSSVNVIHHGTDFVRTDETASAAAIWLLQNGGTIKTHLPVNSVLGREIMPLITAEVWAKIKSGTPNYQSLVEVNPVGLKEWKTKVLKEIIRIFGMMESGDNCLMPGHTPVIETVFNLFCPKGNGDVNMTVRELTGIFLVMSDKKIVAYR